MEESIYDDPSIEAIMADSYLLDSINQTSSGFMEKEQHDIDTEKTSNDVIGDVADDKTVQDFPDFVNIDIDCHYEPDEGTVEFIDDFDQDPVIPTRVKKHEIDPETNDVLFELKDVTIEKDGVIQDINRPEINCSTNPYEMRTLGKSTMVYLHGNLENGETVCVQFKGYKPSFYLTIPEGNCENDNLKEKEKIEKLLKNERDLPQRECASIVLVKKMPSTGFRNGIPVPALLFKFFTLNAFYRYKHFLEKTFPPPTKDEVDQKKYRNEYVLCEHKIPHSMGFCNFHSLKFNGWVKLSAGTYRECTDEVSRAMHSFVTSSVIPVQIDKFSDTTIVSIDIEAKRDDGAEAMPDATNPRDQTLCIGHAVASSSGSFERMYYVFTWGGKIEIPEFDRNGRPIPRRCVIMKVYKDEATMLVHWMRWWSSKHVSPDCVIGWNIFGFDLGYLATRIRILPGIPDDVKEWGRLSGYETKIIESNIESKAISFNKYQLTPSPGVIFVDSLIVFQRDVTLKLPDYQLKTVSKHFLGEEKDDVHYSEIKPLFEGTPKERGILIAYNLQDCDLVLNLVEKCAHWSKMSNVCSVNRIPMNMLCPRGQQIRVFGGFHKNAMDNNYIIYRPHYHPILDEPIIEDPNLWDAENKVTKRFEEKSDIESMIAYFEKSLNLKSNRPTLSILTTDANGNQEEKIIQNETMSAGMIPVPENPNIKVYGKDVNPFQYISEKKKELNSSSTFYTRDGRTMEEVLRQSASKRKRKTIMGENGLLKHIEIVGKRKKTDNENSFKEESEKGFAGGFVMEPKPGFYENIPILDFNALYPNIMMSYFLDPALIVLDKRFANCPNVVYLRIRFNKNKEFLFAQGLPGVMIRHTRNLVDSRKVAQGLMATYESRMEYCRRSIVDILSLSEKTKFDDAIKRAKEYISENKDDDMFNYDLAIRCYESFLKAEALVLKDVLVTDGILNEGVYSDEEILKTAELHKDSEKEKLRKSVSISLNIIQEYKDKINKWKKESFNVTEERGDGKSMVLIQLVLLASSYEADTINYNSKQNELKVGCNSTFGFLGAGGKVQYSVGENRIIHKAMMQVMPVSACVTYIGRKTIEAAKEWVEKNYPGSQVIYADTDSLFVQFPQHLLCRGMDGLMASFVLAKEVANGITKLFSFPGSTMRIVHEKTAKFLIMYSAKCYALDKYVKPPFDENGKIQDPGKLEIKGLPFSKRDCCKFVANLCKNALNMILRQGQIDAAKIYVKDTLMDLVNDRVRASGTDEMDNIKYTKIKLADIVLPFYRQELYEQCHFSLSKVLSGSKLDEISEIALSFIRQDRSKEIKYLKETITEMFEPDTANIVSDIILSYTKQERVKDVRETILRLKTDPIESIDGLSDKLMNQLDEIYNFKESREIRRILHEFVEDKIRLDHLKIYKKLSKKAYNPKATPIQPVNTDQLSRFIKTKSKDNPSTEIKSSTPSGIAAHAQLAERINQRKPGLGPKSGESVQYLFIDLGENSKKKINERYYKQNYVKCGNGFIEDYEYVLQNHIKVDKLWYLENQCTKNITTVFKPLINASEINHLIKDAIDVQKRKQYGMGNSTIVTQLMNGGFIKPKTNSVSKFDMEMW